MTVTVTASTLRTLLGLDVNTLPSATAEAIIDHAANKITANGYTVAVLTGTSGSKTGTYTQAVAGWLIDVATTIYTVIYKNAGATSNTRNIGGLGESSSSIVGSAQTINDSAKQAADSLKLQVNDPPIYVGNSPLPTS